MSTKPGGAGKHDSATQPPGERGARRRNPQRNRGRSDNRNPDKSDAKPTSKVFVGKEEGLGDEYVYLLTSGNEASEQYTRTTAKIIRYLSTKYKNGGDVERSLTDGMRFVIPIPVPPTGTGGVPPADAEMQVWKMRTNMALQREALLESNMESAYALIIGQCSEPILEKVKAQATYVAVHAARDPIQVLELIKSVMYDYISRKYRAVAIIELIETSIVCQTRYMSDSDYLEKFRTKLSVLTATGGEITRHPGMVEDELRTIGLTRATATGAQLQAASQAARERMEGALFLLKSDQNRYGRLAQELANDFNKGRDCYPVSLTAAYELMLMCRDKTTSRIHTATQKWHSTPLALDQ